MQRARDLRTSSLHVSRVTAAKMAYPPRETLPPRYANVLQKQPKVVVVLGDLAESAALARAHDPAGNRATAAGDAAFDLTHSADALSRCFGSEARPVMR